jgi:hypothetical protein
LNLFELLGDDRAPGTYREEQLDSLTSKRMIRSQKEATGSSTLYADEGPN